MSYIYAVSDIHARIDLLREIVNAKVDLKNQNNKLILCGDYIDGEKGTNSFRTLRYIYDLHKQYPNQVIVLRGNHEEWFINWLVGGHLLNINVVPELDLIQDFMKEQEFQSIIIDARKKSHNHVELSNFVFRKCKESILNNHGDLITWLKNLPYYYETENQIFVHAGVVEVEGENEMWKVYSSNDDFLMKYPAEKTLFYKDIIAGHLSTSGITQKTGFHRICRYGSHIYLDQTVMVCRYLNLLKYDVNTNQYTGLLKEDNQWIEYIVRNFSTEFK